MLCSTSFLNLLRRGLYQAVLDSTFPNISGMERGELMHGRALISHNILPRPAPWRGHSCLASLRRKNMGSNSLFMGRSRMSFCTGNWSPERGHVSEVIFTSTTSAEGIWGQWTMDMNIGRRKDVAKGRSIWKRDLHWGLQRGEKKRRFAAGEKCARR